MDRETALRELGVGTPEIQTTAARELGRWSDDQVLGALVETLKSPHRGIREAASDTLIEIGDARAVRLLVPLLRSSVPAVRNAARLLLQRLAKAAPEILIDLSRDPDARMRIFAADIMTESGDHDLAGPLLELLDDPDENVQNAAIAGLGRLGAPEAVCRLERAATEGGLWMRFAAIDALSQIPGLESVRTLLRLLGQVSPDLQEPVVEALGRQGSSEARLPLLRLLGISPELESAIAVTLSGPLGPQALGRLSGPDREALAQALSLTLRLDALKPESRVACLGLAAGLGGTGSAPDLGTAVLSLLSCPETPVQEAAAIAALTLLPAGAVPILRRLQATASRPLCARIEAALSALPKSRKETL